MISLANRILSALHIFSVYEVKDDYGFFEPNRLIVEEAVYKSYYFNGLQGFLSWFIRTRSRSAPLTGDTALRIYRSDYTQKYWREHSDLPAAKEIERSSSPRTERERYAETTVCPPGIH